MNDLSYNEAVEMVSSLNLPTELWINGKSTPSVSGHVFKTENPATGEVIAEVAEGGPADLDNAVRSAREAFNRGVWSRIHPSERKAVLLNFAQLIRDNSVELALLESLDSGKPISDCLAVDVEESAAVIAWHAEAQDKLYDQVAPTGSDTVSMIVREPLGVVAAVLPWNFPLLMAAWKLGPVLATGNSVIVKPSMLTSMSVIRLAQLATEAGLPDGVFNVVTGRGSCLGEAIGLHPDVNVVTFTGSTEVGKKFLEYSGRSNMKRIILECGGKNPCVVLEDARNLDVVADHQAFSIMTNMGQNCASNSRLIVHESVKDKLVAKIVERCNSWKLGNPLESDTQLGATIGRTHYDSIWEYIEKGKAEGATLRCGGNRIEGKGYFIQPTVFDDVTPDMTIAKEEIFGPVLAVISFTDEEEAIRIANDSEYGLTASLHTSDISKAHKISRQLNAGTVTINCYGEGDRSTPFGGFKQSGFGGRDNGIHAHDQYTELKTIWIDLTV
ncbi:aldehyde dehydrogenase [Oceanimonas doudoroffii]|uniref:Aldehyde dehydrogenase n=1 Tax=Oceanimonas doudoroffii TaxID=84158 RepID=A0A233RK82_9GAMM|nr:aldehyde dehydrogenase [Oceanimonas doudoroffii]OXY83799.1 aldehyde dehydrogenase [Oceanimonas doudoroffii]